MSERQEHLAASNDLAAKCDCDRRSPTEDLWAVPVADSCSYQGASTVLDRDGQCLGMLLLLDSFLRKSVANPLGWARCQPQNALGSRPPHGLPASFFWVVDPSAFVQNSCKRALACCIANSLSILRSI